MSDFWTKNRGWIVGVAIATAAWMSWTVWRSAKTRKAWALLPEGPGRMELITHCTSCHDVDRLLAAKPRERVLWEKTIDWMQKMQGMGPLPAEDRRLIVDYLTTHWGDGAPPPSPLLSSPQPLKPE